MLELLGWILFGMAAATVCAVVIEGIVDLYSVKKVMKDKGINSALIKEVNRCNNTIKLESLCGNDVLEISGDGLNYDLKRNDRIYL